MADSLVTGSKITAIANAIRTKTGSSGLLTLDQMPSAISNIPSGGSSIDMTGATGGTWTAYVASHLDVSNITDFSWMFYGAGGYYVSSSVHSSVINETLDLSSWDVSNATDFYRMFSNAGYRKIDLDGWDTSNVTNMQLMFNLYASGHWVNHYHHVWIPSTFVAHNVTNSSYKPFNTTASTSGYKIQVYTNAANATEQGWGTVSSGFFIMHYNYTHEQFLNL